MRALAPLGDGSMRRCIACLSPRLTISRLAQSSPRVLTGPSCNSASTLSSRPGSIRRPASRSMSTRPSPTSGADRARRSRRARRLRARRASPARLRDFGAGGGAGGRRRAHEAHPPDERRDGAVVGRSGARLPAIRHARSHLGRPRRDHGRARLVHRVVSAVRLRSRRLRDAVRGEARSPARHPRQEPQVTWRGAPSRAAERPRASIRARCRIPCPSGSPRAARRNRSRAPARSACRSPSPSSAASRRASRRSPSSIARPAAAPASPREARWLGINGHGFLADTAEAAATRFSRLTPK